MKRNSVFLLILVACSYLPGTVCGDEITNQLQAGKKLMQARNFQDAANTFYQLLKEQKESLTEHPQHAEVWENFGWALKNLGKGEQSAQALKRAESIRALAAKHPNVADNADKAAAEPSDAAPTEQTNSELKTMPTAKGSGQKPEDPEVAKARKSLYAAKPDFAAAEKILQEILAKEPKHCQAMTALGEMHLLRGNNDKAMELFGNARKIDPSDVRPIMGAGNAFLAKAEPAKAVDLFRLAWEIEPSFNEALAKLAKALILAGHTQEGSHLLHQAVHKDPENLEARLELIAIQLANSNDMSASEHLEKCLAVAPQDPRVLFYKGQWLEMRKLLPNAVKDLQWAAHAGGEYGIKAKIYLADIYAGTGHAFPGNPFSNTNQEGKAYYQLFSNPEKALQLYQEALAINPNHPEAQRINAWMDENGGDIAATNALSEQIQGRFRTR